MGSQMRHEDWETRLDGMIERLRDEPMVWSVNDCFTFINACHYALKDEFLADEWFGQYSTAYEAKMHYGRKLKETGHASIIEAIDSKLDRNASMARGSIAARPLEGDTVLGYAFGVVVSDKIAFLTSEGLDFLQPLGTDIFWSVD